MMVKSYHSLRLPARIKNLYGPEQRSKGIKWSFGMRISQIRCMCVMPGPIIRIIRTYTIKKDYRHRRSEQIAEHSTLNIYIGKGTVSYTHLTLPTSDLV